MTAVPNRRGALVQEARSPGAAVGATSGGEAAALYSLHPKVLWRFFAKQQASFWLVCLYTFFEYVRPQQIYTALLVVPWSKLLLFLTPVVFLVEGNGFRARSVLNVLMVAFSMVLLASSVLAVSPADSFDNMQLYINWVMVYIFVANVANTEARFLVFTGLFLLWSTKMSQHGVRSWLENGFRFSSWGATGAPGWFANSGEFGIQMCIFFPLSMYWFVGLRKHWKKWQRMLFLALPASAVASIVATSSRGALVGLGLVGLWMVMRSRYKVRALVGIVALAAIVWTVTPAEQKARFDTAGEDDTSVSRIAYWKHGIDLTIQNPFLGIGYFNWESYHKNRSRLDRTFLPHNIFIQASAEMGALGLIALLLLMGGTLVVNWRTRKLMKPLGDRGHFLHSMSLGLDGALVGYIGSGFFITVLFYPYLWFNLAMTAALFRAAQTLAAEAANGARTAAPVGGLQRAPWFRSGGPVGGRRALPLPQAPRVPATSGARVIVLDVVERDR
ncbi:MAG TPA: O-antigen ligase family protein [Gemmatimonadales bacterium]|nr:O-antigen ligase family protein [Gemmatimonadales bacterium]